MKSHNFVVKALVLPWLIFLSPVHHTFLKHRHTASPLTHTYTYSPFFLRCVCTRLPGRKSFSGMDECLQPIHHPPYPPPSPLFLYQPAVTLTTGGPLSPSPPSALLSLFPPHKSFLCHFSFFLVPSALLALLVRLTVRMFVGVHARFLASSTFFPLSYRSPPALPLSPSPIVFLSPCPSPSIYLSPVHHWDRSGTFRAARKKAL